MNQIGRLMVCWPDYWRDAAIYSGLATPTESGCMFESDAMREKVQAFADKLLELYEIQEVNK